MPLVLRLADRAEGSLPYPPMLTLINTNRMVPAIAPIGLEYVAEAAVRAGIEVSILDLALCEDPQKAIREYFASP